MKKTGSSRLLDKCGRMIYCYLIRARDLHYDYLYLDVLGSLLVRNFVRVGGASIGNGSVIGSPLRVDQRATLSSTTFVAGGVSIGATISVVCSASFGPGLTVGGASVRLGESALLSVLTNVEFGSSLSADAFVRVGSSLLRQ